MATDDEAWTAGPDAAAPESGAFAKAPRSPALAANVRALRLMRGWSPAELAARCHVVPQVILDIQSGACAVPECLLQLAWALRVSPCELLLPPHEIWFSHFLRNRTAGEIAAIKQALENGFPPPD